MLSSRAVRVVDFEAKSVRRRTKPLPTRAARQALERILLSPDFDASRRSRDFLCFVVEEAWPDGART